MSVRAPSDHGLVASATTHQRGCPHETGPVDGRSATASGRIGGLEGVSAASATIIDSMYKATIQATLVAESNWRVVASGTWTPGQQPQLAEHILPAEVVEALFNVSPSATVKSGRNQVQFGDTLYAVVFRRLSTRDRHVSETDKR